MYVLIMHTVLKVNSSSKHTDIYLAARGIARKREKLLKIRRAYLRRRKRKFNVPYPDYIVKAKTFSPILYYGVQ